MNSQNMRDFRSLAGHGSLAGHNDGVVGNLDEEFPVSEPEKRQQNPDTRMVATMMQRRMALELGKIGSWERDLVSGEMIADPICRTHLGLTATEPLTYGQMQQLRHPDDAERVEQAISFALATKTDFQVSHRVVRPDGEIARIQFRGAALYENGKPVRLVGVIQDRTEQEKAKEEAQRVQQRQSFLLKLNEQLRDLVDPAKVKEVIVQSLGRFLNVNCVAYGEIDVERAGVFIERQWSDNVIDYDSHFCPFNADPRGLGSSLAEGHTVVMDDILSDPRTAEDPTAQAAFATQNARSCLIVPLRRNEQLKALLYIGASQPRAWSSEDIALVEDICERVWIVVEKARAERAWRKTEAKLRAVAAAPPLSA